MEKFTTPIPANRMCFWFAAGDPREPRTALVTAGDEYGILDLAVFGKNFSKHLPKGGVRHKDDPFLKKRPLTMIDTGTWDYLPGFEMEQMPTNEASKEEQEPAKEPLHTEESMPIPSKEETDKEVMTLRDEGKSALEISTMLTKRYGAPFTHQRVNAALRKFETQGI